MVVYYWEVGSGNWGGEVEVFFPEKRGGSEFFSHMTRGRVEVFLGQNHTFLLPICKNFLPWRTPGLTSPNNLSLIMVIIEYCAPNNFSGDILHVQGLPRGGGVALFVRHGRGVELFHGSGEGAVNFFSKHGSKFPNPPPPGNKQPLPYALLSV